MGDTLNIDPARWSGSSLRGCSLEARGLWAELLCIMHQGPTRGQLRTDAGTPMGQAQIGRICGIPTAKAEELLRELEEAGVSQRIDGCISCVWMLKQEEIRTYERDRKRTQRERVRPPPEAEGNGLASSGKDAGTTQGQAQGQAPGQKMGVGGVFLPLSGETPDNTRSRNSEIQRLTEQKNQTKARAQSAGKTRTDFPGFDAFWAAYPTKVGKPLCLEKWRKRGLELLALPILDGLERWKSSDRWQRGYVCDPHKFLNQRFWEDTPKPAETDPTQVPDRGLEDFDDDPEFRQRMEALQRSNIESLTPEELKSVGAIFTPRQPAGRPA